MFAAGAAALLAGCSDATRFSDPFSDPFQGQSTSRSVDRAPTGTISRPLSEAPRNSIQSRPLPPPQAVSQSAPPPAAAIAQAQAAPGRKAGAYNHWSAEGGTPVVVAEGETAGAIATRYGVPTDALLRVNGFAKPGEVQPGSRLVIPVYRAAAAAEPAPIESRQPVAAKTADVRDRIGKAPKKTGDVAEAKSERKSVAAAKPVPAKPVAAARPTPIAPVKTAAAKPSAPPAAAKAAAPVKAKVAKSVDEDEAKLAKAKRKTAQAEPPAAAAPRARVEQSARTQDEKPAQDAKRSAAPMEKREQKVAAAPEAPAARKVDKTPTASIPPQEEEKPAASEAARPEFRWPARGRIIQGFNSGGNDGINISVPEGTQVKAAEGGVVAYAGSELKGYGNLVLIRHPNGFVSAYAHNAEIEVRRGDQVKRGQTIAKSGQSGNVGSPQLHFELRKGSTPVDPTSYLAGL